MRHVVSTFPLVVVAVALATLGLGCGSLGDFGNAAENDMSYQDTSTEDGTQPNDRVACVNNVQCASNLCFAGECAPCDASTPCTTGTCVSGQCVQCQTDDDCPTGSCLDQVCVDDGDVECFEGSDCDGLGSGLACFAGDCISSTSVASAFSCGGGVAGSNSGELHSWSTTGPALFVTGTSQGAGIRHIAGSAMPVLTGPGGAK